MSKLPAFHLTLTFLTKCSSPASSNPVSEDGFVTMPGGTYVVGCDEQENGCRDVTVGAFVISRYETSSLEWRNTTSTRNYRLPTVTEYEIIKSITPRPEFRQCIEVLGGQRCGFSQPQGFSNIERTGSLALVNFWGNVAEFSEGVSDTDTWVEPLKEKKGCTEDYHIFSGNYSSKYLATIGEFACIPAELMLSRTGFRLVVEDQTGKEN